MPVNLWLTWRMYKVRVGDIYGCWKTFGQASQTHNIKEFTACMSDHLSGLGLSHSVLPTISKRRGMGTYNIKESTACMLITKLFLSFVTVLLPLSIMVYNIYLYPLIDYCLFYGIGSCNTYLPITMFYGIGWCNTYLPITMSYRIKQDSIQLQFWLNILENITMYFQNFW